MGRIFFFLLLALGAYVAWQWLQRGNAAGRSSDARPRVEPPQPMVQCARCGVHLPRLDALPAGDRYFCSEEHRRAGASS
jgi:uncharacterized protein